MSNEWSDKTDTESRFDDVSVNETGIMIVTFVVEMRGSESLAYAKELSNPLLF